MYWSSILESPAIALARPALARYLDPLRFSPYLHFRVFLEFSLFVLPALCHGISCSSRHYCITPEVKYISMEEVPNSYLNTTAIRTHEVTNVSQCQKLCVRENNCQSINLSVNKTEGYSCNLLSANKYSNSSLIVEDINFIHLYIPVSRLCLDIPSTANQIGPLKHSKTS